MGKSTLRFSSPLYLVGRGNTVSEYENEGPLSGQFDEIMTDEYFGEKTFEKAEVKLQQSALSYALLRAGIGREKLDVAFGGDLLNQCIASGYSLRNSGVPFVGLYGACSTMALSMATASLALSAGFGNYAAAMTSSHFCGAERQFRYPLEYGGQRPPSAQRTVTGAGAVILSREQKSDILVDTVTFGKIIDFDVTDINNMGAAMAPAAFDTLRCFFEDTASLPQEYDLIATGDLASVGQSLLRQMMEQNGMPLGENYKDCGLMVYDREKQDVHAGGSGCGCSAVVLTADILPKMEKGELSKVLLIGTGALMSPLTVMQGESIPAVAHLVYLRREKETKE